MKSKVYFTDMKTTFTENLPQKLARLIESAGIREIDFKDKFTAIKIHFGEPGNLAFLRPNYAAVVVDMVKELGGKPFLTDCNTLYVGGRKNALDHLDAAYKNGFSPLQTGCQVIIADGLKGMDEEFIPVKNGEYVKDAKIGKAVADADIIISLNHFKGHEAAGFGGAMKNLGMGCGSRAGKVDMHCDGKPEVNQKICVGCGRCVRICAHGAPQLSDKKASIDQSKCLGCGRCIGVCPVEAISVANSSSNDLLNRRIAEYAMAVCQDKPNFHINIIVDVSPNCDCHSENDIPIVPNIGMLASFDPVALDKACADLVNKQPVIVNSQLDRNIKKAGINLLDKVDRFNTSAPGTDWIVQVKHAEKIGLGSSEYELITI